MLSSATPATRSGLPAHHRHIVPSTVCDRPPSTPGGRVRGAGSGGPAQRPVPLHVPQVRRPPPRACGCGPGAAAAAQRTELPALRGEIKAGLKLCHAVGIPTCWISTSRCLTVSKPIWWRKCKPVLLCKGWRCSLTCPHSQPSIELAIPCCPQPLWQFCLTERTHVA